MSAPGAAAPPASPVAPPPGPTGAAAPPSEAVAQIEHRWQPAENAPRVQLGAPEPVAGADPKSPARMYPPNVTAEPPLRDSAGTGLPVGIRQFATAMDNVAVGLQPSGEGLEWLKAHGYRAVLHIHLPGEDETTDRKTAEQHGLKYSSLEVSPQALTKATAQEFNRSVGDTSNHPLFVYDADGALAGGLWYLHFRLNQQFSDDVARLRASALGLREQSTGLHGDMWLAIQKYLSEGDR